MDVRPGEPPPGGRLPPKPPPKRKAKDRRATHTYGTGLNAVRFQQQLSNNNDVNDESDSDTYVVSPGQVYDVCDDFVVGESVDVRGTLHCKGVVRVNGSFDGDLVCHGDLIVGPKGRVELHKASFVSGTSVSGKVDYRQLLVHGGNVEFKQGIAVGELILDPGSKLKGNVTSRSMRVQGSDVSIKGKMSIQVIEGEDRKEEERERLNNNRGINNSNPPTSAQEIYDNYMKEYIEIKKRRQLTKGIVQFTSSARTPGKYGNKRKENVRENVKHKEKEQKETKVERVALPTKLEPIDENDSTRGAIEEENDEMDMEKANEGNKESEQEEDEENEEERAKDSAEKDEEKEREEEKEEEEKEEEKEEDVDKEEEEEEEKEKDKEKETDLESTPSLSPSQGLLVSPYQNPVLPLPSLKYFSVAESAALEAYVGRPGLNYRGTPAPSMPVPDTGSSSDRGEKKESIGKDVQLPTSLLNPYHPLDAGIWEKATDSKSGKKSTQEQVNTFKESAGPEDADPNLLMSMTLGEDSPRADMLNESEGIEKAGGDGDGAESPDLSPRSKEMKKEKKERKKKKKKDGEESPRADTLNEIEATVEAGDDDDDGAESPALSPRSKERKKKKKKKRDVEEVLNESSDTVQDSPRSTKNKDLDDP